MASETSPVGLAMAGPTFAKLSCPLYPHKHKKSRSCDDSRASPASKYRVLYTTGLTMTSAKLIRTYERKKKKSKCVSCYIPHNSVSNQQY